MNILNTLLFRVRSPQQSGRLPGNLFLLVLVSCYLFIALSTERSNCNSIFPSSGTLSPLVTHLACDPATSSQATEP